MRNTLSAHFVRLYRYEAVDRLPRDDDTWACGPPHADHGLGIGTAVTSVIFLTAIVATVFFLSVVVLETA